MEICRHCLNLSNNSGSVEVWKCGNVEICLPCLCLITPEEWKCGNVEMWKCGNVEMWKCGNMSSMSLSNNSGRKCGNVEMWKYVFLVFV